MLLTTIAPLDAVLARHERELGRDAALYRNHVYRVANLCLALSSPDADTVHKVALAAAFHDIGIWTAGTFDYLEPSVVAAGVHLARSGKAEWIPEISAMIREHHRIRPYRGRAGWLVEPFRRADWIDVSRGALTFGLARSFIAEVIAMWPTRGFHRRLAALTARRLRTHPWSPLPMLKL